MNEIATSNVWIFSWCGNTVCVTIKKFGNSKNAKEVLEGEVFYTIPDRIK